MSSSLGQPPAPAATSPEAPADPRVLGAHATPAPSPLRPPLPPRLLVWLLPPALALLSFLVFLPALQAKFINFDDNLYVWGNRFVSAGLTPDSIRWAFTTRWESNWHPLTWLSLMLDASLWGIENPGGFHLTNLLLHGGNVALLCLALQRMTGSAWRAALASALFAIHPLRVESVVWVTERKDVLSTLLGFLALLAYLRYARKPSPARMALVLPPYVLSLMSKPMLVTLPALLLLLDLYPLRRWPGGAPAPAALAPDAPPQPFPPSTPARLLLEKLPLGLIALASCCVTLFAASQVDTMRPLSELGIGARLGNVLVAMASYLGLSFWPTGLALFYPLPPYQPAPLIALSAVTLLAVACLVLALARRAPHLALGWLWFIVSVLPVVGLVHVGLQSRADRYTYIPCIGLAVALAWSIPWPSARLLRAAVVALLVTALASLALATRAQIAHWRDAQAIARRTLAVTTDNWLAHNLLGASLAAEGQLPQAIEQYRLCLRLRPGYAIGHCNLAQALVDLDRRDPTGQAEVHYRRAIQIHPHIGRYHMGLADLFVYQGRFDLAEATYRLAIKVEPTLAEAQNNLAVLLEKTGRPTQAIPHYLAALSFVPDYPSAHRNLGLLLLRLGRYDEAIVHFQAVLRAQPGDDVTRRRLKLAKDLKNAPPLDSPRDATPGANAPAP